MSRDLRLFLHGSAETSGWDKVVTWFHLGFSFEARRRKRRFAEVQRILSCALADPDTVYHMELRPLSKAVPKKWNLWAAFTILAVISVLEWSRYSLPALSGWMGTVLHRCGLR